MYIIILQRAWYIIIFLERLEVDQISGHQLVRGWGGVLAVMYETHCVRLLSHLREREQDLQHLTGFTSSAIGRAPRHNTASPTAYTGRCASGSLTAN